MLSLPVIAVLALTTLAVHTSPAKHKHCHRQGQKYEKWQCDVCGHHDMKHTSNSDEGVCVPSKADFDDIAKHTRVGNYAGLQWENFIVYNSGEERAALRAANHSIHYAVLPYNQTGIIHFGDEDDHRNSQTLGPIDHTKPKHPGNLHSYRFGCVDSMVWKRVPCEVRWYAECRVGTSETPAGVYWDVKYKPNKKDKPKLRHDKPKWMLTQPWEFNWSWKDDAGLPPRTRCSKYTVKAQRDYDAKPDYDPYPHLVLDDVLFRTFEKDGA